MVWLSLVASQGNHQGHWRMIEEALLFSHSDEHFTGTDKSSSCFKLTQFVGDLLPDRCSFRLAHPCQHLVQSTE
jgi:hypothetical protein